MINIQSKLRTAPDLCKNVSLAVLFVSSGNSCTVSTQSEIYIYNIYIYIQGVPVVKVNISGFNSRADSESKTLYTHESNSQRFRSYEFLKYSK